MGFVRFLIVKQSSPNDSFYNDIKTYEGMNRAKLGSFPDVPDPLLQRGFALEDLPPGEVGACYQALLKEMLEIGVTGYELLMLGDSPPVGWEFLGYDVGETTKAAWSAIAHRDIFLSSEEKTQWEEQLNSHGLFQERAEAEAFLVRYLDSDDPDMGWTADGWIDTPDEYAVIPVHRYRCS